MSQVKESLIELIRSAGEDYVNDLHHLSTEQLDQSPGGSARKGADFSFEVAIVNQRIAARVRGENKGPWPYEGWVTAPDGSRSQEALIALVRDSVDEVINALEGIDEEMLFAPITSGGQETTLFKAASMCAVHTSYHDAQLNYIQSILGDMEIHWK